MYLTTCRPQRAVQPSGRNLSLFDEFFAPFSRFAGDTTAGGYRPPVDIYEKDEKLHVEAELPGFSKEDIKIDVKGNLLTITGERTNDEAVTDEKSYRRERMSGSFQRSFKLPFELSEERITATHKDGVLRLLVERPEELKARQITIN
ncbi:MAG: Hsp20/alpha crystallin family protein [Desulfocapsaceae bacterium]|jgi:HSP20 family protein|nr:Hsp20/alpha crystallin family protein [Desulfocapsaceae bacterium]